MKKYFKAIWLFLKAKEVKVLSVQEGDIIVVKPRTYLLGDDKKRFMSNAAKALNCLGIKNKLIILDPDEDIGVIRQFREGE